MKAQSIQAHDWHCKGRVCVSPASHLMSVRQMQTVTRAQLIYLHGGPKMTYSAEVQYRSGNGRIRAGL